MKPSPELATLAADPERIEDLDRSKVPALLGKLVELEAHLRLKLALPSGENGPAPSDLEKASGDRLLTVEEAAPRLGLNVKALYRRADRLPFTRKLGPRTLRFSENGLERWLESKRR